MAEGMLQDETVFRLGYRQSTPTVTHMLHVRRHQPCVAQVVCIIISEHASHV